MNPADIELDALLRRLHLPTGRRLLPELEPRAAAEGWPRRDFVAVLIGEEVAHRNGTRVSKAARNARFPTLGGPSWRRKHLPETDDIEPTKPPTSAP